MTDDQIQYLFLIRAYRDNEVSPSHPLMMTLEMLQKEGAIAPMSELPMEVCVWVQ